MSERIENPLEKFYSDIGRIGLLRTDERNWISREFQFTKLDWRDLTELGKIEDLQNKAWKFGERNMVPSNILAVIDETGGELLTVQNRSGDRHALAFTLTLATEDPKKHFLHMVAVDPELQSADVGRKIMLLEGAIARSKGVEIIEWTYDPLMGGNSNLYLTKLHAEPYKYTVNKYGIVKNSNTKGESRYKDVPTDRFTVKWNVGNEYIWQAATKSSNQNHSTLPEMWDGNGAIPDSFRFGVPFDFTTLSTTQMLEARQSLRQICLRVMDHDDFSSRDFVIGTHKVIEFIPDPNKLVNTYTFVRK